MNRNSYNERSPLLHAKYKSINLPTTVTLSSERYFCPKQTASFQYHFSSYDRSSGTSHIMDFDNKSEIGGMNLDDQSTAEISTVSTTNHGEKNLPTFSITLESLQLGGAVITWKRGVQDKIRSLISLLSNENRRPEPAAVTCPGNFKLTGSSNVRIRNRSGVNSTHLMSIYAGFLSTNTRVKTKSISPTESATKTISTIRVDRSHSYLFTF